MLVPVLVFENANHAFTYFCDEIMRNGEDTKYTRKLRNVGFTIKRPLDNKIDAVGRNWKEDYAATEWDWYVSADPSVTKPVQGKGKGKSMVELAKLWVDHADPQGNVNSNYGFQWKRGNQLARIIEKLKFNSETRQAWLTIYDGKEIESSGACATHGYMFDTPCTLSIGFDIDSKGHLNMTVLMRSNDLFYGFCNDQYCFSQLQKYVADQLHIPVGTYYHFASDLHIYKTKFKEVTKINENA